jgi:hypothetical protein
MVALLLLSMVFAKSTSVLNDQSKFPIAVWLQSTSNAERYKIAGFNLYVGLWEGPQEEDLKALKSAGMPVICDQNAVGLAHRTDPTIVGWLQQDEPDNAQPAAGGGYGPCIPPQTIIDRYKSMKAKDPTRPVLLNLGQGVANDEWIGRGNGSSLDDYKTYVKAGDIVSFDIYPVAGLPKPNSEDYLYMVPKGIDRIRNWVDNKTPSWNCIECTSIDGGKKATPDQVKAEVWMSIIHGSTGLVYFVHQFKPTFKEAAILDDKPMLESVTRNHQLIQSLSRVIHSGKVIANARATSPNPKTPVDILAKRFDGATYIFSVGMRNSATSASFSIPGLISNGKVEVIGESRSISVLNGEFSDTFKPYEVHLYRVNDKQ